MTSLTVASLNIRGFPLAGSRMVSRYQAIGAYFEASDVDVACLQEVCTYGHLALLARQMRSFRYVSYRRALCPAGDVVTFSRLPVTATVYHGFGPVTARVPRLARLRARLTGALVTTLAGRGLSVVNTHPLANSDGDWSAANRFFPAHRAQLAALSRAVAGIPAPAVVCGDFNVDRESALFRDFVSETGLGDVFEGRCPPTFRAEYLPAGSRSCCIDFILATGGVKASSAEVLFTGKQVLRGGPGYVSDHLGLSARLDVPDA
jgi:sphingomyelin phosphodiesterase 2